MVETYLRQSPLASRALDANLAEDAGDTQLQITERRFLLKINVRGQGIETNVENAVGVLLPSTPNTVAVGNNLTALWLGPDEWLIVGPADTEQALTEALEAAAPAVIDVSEGRTVVRLSGTMARDVLAMGCPLDLHPTVFSAGQCAQSHIARTTIILHQVDDDPTYDIYVERSQADYLWTWLGQAGAPYGVAVVAVLQGPSSWRRPPKPKDTDETT